jgi:2-dehydropantoate 2-reductase
MHWREPKLRSAFHVKICIFGAGAIGGYLAVELSLAGHDVCAIARGPHLKAIQQNGLKLLTDGHSKIARIEASDEPKTFGPQDIVICTLKAHQAMRALRNLSRCCGTIPRLSRQ